jgi:hypothetical protein
MNEKGVQVSTTGTHKVGTIETEGKVFTMSETCWSTIKHESEQINDSLKSIDSQLNESNFFLTLLAKPESYFTLAVSCLIDHYTDQSNNIAFIVGLISLIIAFVLLAFTKESSATLKAKISKTLGKLESIVFQINEVQKSRNE